MLLNILPYTGQPPAPILPPPTKAYQAPNVKSAAAEIPCSHRKQKWSATESSVAILTGSWAPSKPFSSMTYMLATHTVVHRSAPPASFLEMQNLTPHRGQRNQNVHFTKNVRGLLYTLQSEEHCGSIPFTHPPVLPHRAVCPSPAHSALTLSTLPSKYADLVKAATLSNVFSKMSSAAEAPCRHQFTRRPFQEKVAPPPTTRSGLHHCFLYPRSKIPSLLMTWPGPDDRAICLHLLLQGTSFQVAFSLYRCSGYLADWHSDLVSPQP